MTALITYPLMWFAALALPMLVSIYFLHHRYRQRKVSSLMLWAQGRQISSGGRTLKRFSFPWIFLLELLILSLLILAGLGLSYSRRQPRRRIAVVLDDSISMQARHKNGRSSQEEALRSLGQLLSDPRISVARAVIAGSEMIPLEADTTPDLLLRIRQHWTCRSDTADLIRAQAALKRTHPGIDLVVVTDHPPPPGSPVEGGTLWLACGEGLDNLAIINAVRNPGSSTHSRCLAEIANYSPSPRRAKILWQAGGTTIEQETVHVPANDTVILEKRLPHPADVIGVMIADDDALAIDNSVQLVPPPPRDLRIMLSIADPRLREIIIETVKATASAFIVTRNPELLITDQPTAEEHNAPAVLQLLRSPGMLACTGPFVIDSSHPLTDGLDSDGLVWAASTNAAPSGTALVSAGNTPLLAVGSPGRDRTLVSLQMDLTRTNIHLTPAWPVLFWNLVDWRLNARSGFVSPNFHGGMPFHITAGSAERVFVTDPSGKTEEHTSRGGRILLGSHTPGIYTARIGERLSRAAFNILSPEESNLLNNRTESRGALSTDPAMLDSLASSTPWLALAALILLFCHHRIITGGQQTGGIQ